MPGLRSTDRELYAAIEQAGSPQVDTALRTLSQAANYSRLWMAAAGALALFGGPDGRMTAATGMVAVGVTSAAVNQGFKRLLPRRRPPRTGQNPVRHVAMPSSTSFPSGHSASAFAFAQAVSASRPWTGMALRFVAAAVAYSRVHVGVHYPGDVVAGAVIGSVIGQATVDVMDRRP